MKRNHKRSGSTLRIDEISRTRIVNGVDVDAVVGNNGKLRFAMIVLISTSVNQREPREFPRS